MKYIKSPILGVKKLEESSSERLIELTRDVLASHRSELLKRLIMDVPTYIRYRFEVKPTSTQLQEIKDALYNIRNNDIDMDLYQPIVQQVLNRTNVYLTNELFYKEFDEAISYYINVAQLKLIK